MLQSLIRQGRDAQQVGAWDEAIAHFETALALVPPEGDPSNTADILRWMGVVYRDRGDLTSAAEKLQASRATADDAGLRDKAASAIRRFLDRGGRWFALHASNSVAGNQAMPRILGTRFISHPEYMTFPVKVTRAEEPLLQGIGDFEVPDELYCIEDVARDLDVLLHARWGGEGFDGSRFEEADRPILYRRAVGEGGVLYLALGHANRPYDKPAHAPEQPDYRGPWDLPVFQELVKRGVEWAAQRRPF